MSKENLEIQKLELEVKKLKRNFFFRIETYVLLIPILCIIVTYFLNRDYIKQSLELDLKRVEIKKTELNFEIKELESKKEVIKTRIENLEKRLQKSQSNADEWKSRAKFYSTKYRESKSIKNSTPSLEDKYNEAVIQYNKGEYNNSEAICWDILSKSETSESLTGKSFLLLAKGFMRQKNYTDAREVLYSLLENYKPNDGILSEGKDLLEQAESKIKIIRFDF